MDRTIIIKRLAFIKYLLNQANNASHFPEPLSSSSILSFHDAVELFLHLCAEQYNLNTKNISFIEYWEKLKPLLSNANKSELTQKESMRRLNDTRVSLKHHGTLPSKLDIDNFRVICNTFFEENCKNIFDVKINDISLIELIIYAKTKNYLTKANEEFLKSDLPACIKNLSLAFEFLIHDYEQTKRSRFGDSPFFFGEDMTFLSSFHMGINGQDKLSDFVDKVKESIESMQKAVKILSFGIDYRKYVKFSLFTPKPIWTIDSQEPLISISPNAKISKEEFEYCFNFIIESALKLQEFDFEIQSENRKL